MRTTSVLAFGLGGASRYFLNALTTRLAPRAANGANRWLGTLGCGFGCVFLRHEHRQHLKQQYLGSYPLFSISWVGYCRGRKTSKAVEKLFGRVAISTRGGEVRTKDKKVSLYSLIVVVNIEST